MRGEESGSCHARRRVRKLLLEAKSPEAVIRGEEISTAVSGSLAASGWRERRQLLAVDKGPAATAPLKAGVAFRDKTAFSFSCRQVAPVHVLCARPLCTSPMHVPYVCPSARPLCTSPVHVPYTRPLCTSLVHVPCTRPLCTSLYLYPWHTPHKSSTAPTHPRRSGADPVCRAACLAD